MVLHGDDVAVIAPRVGRAMRSPDPKVRQLGFVAAGDMARLYTTPAPQPRQSRRRQTPARP